MFFESNYTFNINVQTNYHIIKSANLTSVWLKNTLFTYYIHYTRNAQNFLLKVTSKTLAFNFKNLLVTHLRLNLHPTRIIGLYNHQIKLYCSKGIATGNRSVILMLRLFDYTITLGERLGVFMANTVTESAVTQSMIQTTCD